MLFGPILPALLISTVGVCCAVSTVNKVPTSYTFPAAPSVGDADAIFRSMSKNPFDGVYVDKITNTSFQWWYFDAVSTSRSCKNCTFVATYFATTAAAFPLLDDIPGALNLYVWVTFPNGTSWSNAVVASVAKINTVGDGSNGDWVGTGGRWTSTPNLSDYVVTIDSKELGVHGEMKLRSAAPAHYACGPNEAGHSTLVAPHLGWSNAIPDAEATVSIFIDPKGSDSIKFTGVGYHDSNWGDQPTLSNSYGWYWGHASLGDYSIVWFQTILSPDGKDTKSSAYVSREGKILTARCGGLKVRPDGGPTAYPPRFTIPLPTSFTVSIDVDEGKLVVILSELFLIAGGDTTGNVYDRWAITATGKIVTGNKDVDAHALVSKGRGITEQFALQP